VWFSAAGMVGRLPLSMAGLGIVLLVQGHDGSYGIAGAVSGSYMLANAAVALPLGRRLDAWGQGRVLTASSLVFGAAMTTLVVSVEAGWPRGATYAAAAVAGAALPPIDSCVRTRWAHVIDQPGDLETAFAFEAAVDETVFILGPVLVTVLATVIDPVAGAVATILLGVGGALAFAVQRGTEPPSHPRAAEETGRVPLPWRTLVPVAGVCAGLGLIFGATEVTTVAFARAHGATTDAGLLLALWALGSLVAGLVTGTVHWRSDLRTRVRWGSLGMAAAMAPLALVGSIWLMGALMLVGGLAIAPTLIAATALIEQVTPSARLNEGMAVLQTGLVVGVAPGAAIAGAVIDHAGASTAYLVALAAGILTALVARAIPAPAAESPAAAPALGTLHS
jgi:MFS family permease